MSVSCAGESMSVRAQEPPLLQSMLAKREKIASELEEVDSLIKSLRENPGVEQLLTHLVRVTNLRY